MCALRKTKAEPGFEMQDVSIPTPGPDEVLIQVKEVQRPSSPWVGIWV